MYLCVQCNLDDISLFCFACYQLENQHELDMSCIA